MVYINCSKRLRKVKDKFVVNQLFSAGTIENFADYKAKFATGIEPL